MKNKPTDIPECLKKQLAIELSASFEGALAMRGRFTTQKYTAIKNLLRTIGDDLADFDGYAQYGLPLFKAVAEKYGFPNPIGADTGEEFKYSADSKI